MSWSGEEVKLRLLEASSPVGPKFRITEIFGPTIQGEGSLIGQTSHFVRFAGCDSRCTWCDTKGSVEPTLYLKDGVSRRLAAPEIAAEVLKLGAAMWVTLSGGNPLLFDLTELVLQLKHYPMRLAVETQGTLYKDWVDFVDFLTVSPKPPSADTPTASWATIKRLLNRKMGTACLKFVVRDEEDFQFACQTAQANWTTPSYLQPCADEGDTLEASVEKLQWLGERVLKLQRESGGFIHNFTVLPQLHKLLDVR